MPFLGTTPTQGFVSSVDKQSITNANGVLTDFILTHPVANANDLEVFVGNVRQEPGVGKAYTAAGTTLSMSEAPAAGTNFYVIFKNQAQVTTTPPDGSVSSTKLGNNITLSTAAGTNSAPSINFTGDTDTGIYNPVANRIALVTGGVENFRLSDGFISYGNGDNSYSNSMSQHCGIEELVPTNTTAGATETVTATRSLPYQMLTPVSIKVVVNGNNAIMWHFQVSVFNTYHGAFANILSSPDGTGGTYFDATPVISTSGAEDARKITVQLNTASNTNPSLWRVFIEYGIGGPT